MDLGLQGKIVLVTASAGGIGYAIADGFLKEGATVILNGRNLERLIDIKSKLSINYSENQIDLFAGDLTIESSIIELEQFILNKYKKLDVLALNLGSGKPTQDNKLDQNEWNYLMQINLLSAVKTIDMLLSLLQKGTNANIIFISSIVAYEYSAAPYAYSAAKAGILSLAKNLSYDLAGKGIRVNSIVPGNIYFPGGRWEEIISKDEANTIKMLEERVPMRRFGTPSEIADSVVFIASAKSAFTTGSTLVIDGGQKRGI